MKTIKKKTKKKVFIDGKPQKVEYNVYMVIKNLQEQIRNHDIALLTWVHKIYNNKKKHNDDEKILHNYCMQIPNSEGILNKMKELKDEAKNNN